MVGGSTVGLSGLGSRASSLVTTKGLVAARITARAALRAGVAGPQDVTGL